MVTLKIECYRIEDGVWCANCPKLGKAGYGESMAKALLNMAQFTAAVENTPELRKKPPGRKRAGPVLAVDNSASMVE